MWNALSKEQLRTSIQKIVNSSSTEDEVNERCAAELGYDAPLAVWYDDRSFDRQPPHGMFMSYHC